jgi:antitoxin VapB
MPTLNNKDPEVYSMAAQLSRQTGKSMTVVVKEALADRLARVPEPKGAQERLIARVMELVRLANAHPLLDNRTPDEILGYDEAGVPK